MPTTPEKRTSPLRWLAYTALVSFFGVRDEADGSRDQRIWSYNLGPRNK